MAAGTFEITSEEKAGDILSEAVVIPFSKESHCGAGFSLSSRRNHLAYENVPAWLALEALFQVCPPFVVGDLAELLPLQQHDGEAVGPVFSEVFAGKQLINDPATLVC